VSKVSVETTHNIEIDYTAATLADRSVASILDLVMLILVIFGVTLLFSEFLNVGFWDVRWMVVSFVLSYVFFGMYSFWCEWLLDGQTFGKRLLKIRVVRIDGSPATAGSYFMRWVLWLIEVLASLGSIALLSTLLSKHSQRLGDMAAGTTVVKIPKPVTLDQLLLSVDSNQQTETPFEPHAMPPIVFPQVSSLSEADILAIQSLLLATLDRSINREHVVDATYKAKAQLCSRLGITSHLNATEFLQQIVKDYGNRFSAL
jgi:uncharacterized RDD family membrane protein YckC